jgi:hypothetical protein
MARIKIGTPVQPQQISLEVFESLSKLGTTEQIAFSMVWRGEASLPGEIVDVLSFLSEREVRDAIEQLVESGLIVVGPDLLLRPKRTPPEATD